MTTKTRHRSPLWPWVVVAVAALATFWILMAWQHPEDKPGPLWFAGTWYAPEGEPGNRIVFQANGADVGSVGNLTRLAMEGTAEFTNTYGEGVQIVDWKMVNLDPFILQLTVEGNSIIPPYAALRWLDSDNMQIRFTNDVQAARAPFFLSGKTADVLVRAK